MQEIYRPRELGSAGGPLHGVFYTLTAKDVGATRIAAEYGGTVITIPVSEVMGRVLKRDVGKRMVAILSNDKTSTVWQVENDQQRDARLAKGENR